MKINSLLLGLVCAFSGLTLAAAGADTAAARPGKVGVYDSRIVAYAHFWSAPERKRRDDLVGQARRAKEAGAAVEFGKLEARIKELNRDSHLAAFSTFPADAAMAALEEKLPAIRQELGVDRFLSQWDEKALGPVPAAARIDVTERLLRELLAPDGQQRKVIDAMKRTPPLPRWKAKLLLWFGSL